MAAIATLQYTADYSTVVQCGNYHTLLTDRHTLMPLTLLPTTDQLHYAKVSLTMIAAQLKPAAKEIERVYCCVSSQGVPAKVQHEEE